MKARQRIIDGASREEAKRLLAAFDLAWKSLESRAGDPETVSENIARHLLSIGRVRPELRPSDLAEIVCRMFNAPRE